MAPTIESSTSHTFYTQDGRRDPSTRTTFETEIERLNAEQQNLGERLEDYASDIASQAPGHDATWNALSLKDRIEDLSNMAEYLLSAPFRIMVLGDVNSGKSSILNVLLGDNLLPSDAMRHTGILTVLRYGRLPRVTVYSTSATGHFSNMGLSDFREQYTLPAALTRAQQRDRVASFQDVSHAIIEFDLPLLANGIEIVDSPGLNNSADHNQLSLWFASQCHVALFVVDALALFAPVDRQYIDTYLQDQKTKLFFLLNKWDLIAQRAVDPYDSNAVSAAQEHVRQRLRTSLTAVFDSRTDATFEDRVFELKTRDALRRLAHASSASLEGTGYPEFFRSLTTYLKDRYLTRDVLQAKRTVSDSFDQIRNAIARRLFFLARLDRTHTMPDISPYLTQLTVLREDVSEALRAHSVRTVAKISEDVGIYSQTLLRTIENDPGACEALPVVAQPTDEPTDFEAEYQATFERCLSTTLMDLARFVQIILTRSFDDLGTLLSGYANQYAGIVDAILATAIQTSDPPSETEAVSSGDSSRAATALVWARWSTTALNKALIDLGKANVAAADSLDWTFVAPGSTELVGGPELLSAALGLRLRESVARPLAAALTAMIITAERSDLQAMTHQTMLNLFPSIRSDVSTFAQDIYSRYNELVLETIGRDISAWHRDSSRSPKRDHDAHVGSDAGALRDYERYITEERVALNM